MALETIACRGQARLSMDSVAFIPSPSFTWLGRGEHFTVDQAFSVGWMIPDTSSSLVSIIAAGLWFHRTVWRISVFLSPLLLIGVGRPRQQLSTDQPISRTITICLSLGWAEIDRSRIANEPHTCLWLMIWRFVFSAALSRSTVCAPTCRMVRSTIGEQHLPCGREK